MVLLGGSSAIITPMLLHLLLPWVTGDASLNVDIGKLIGTLLLGQVAPLVLGLLVVERRPPLAAKLKKPFERATSVLTLTYIVLILASQFSMLAHVRLRGFVGMMTLWAAALTVGWLAGAPGRDNRSARALTTAERNDGLAMVIVTGNFAGTPAVPAAMIYGLVEMLATLFAALGLRQWASRRGSIAAATAGPSAMGRH
jgi:predicted Na+-dependent transporter